MQQLNPRGLTWAGPDCSCPDGTGGIQLSHHCWFINCESAYKTEVSKHGVGFKVLPECQGFNRSEASSVFLGPRTFFFFETGTLHCWFFPSARAILVVCPGGHPSFQPAKLLEPCALSCRIRQGAFCPAWGKDPPSPSPCDHEYSSEQSHYSDRSGSKSSVTFLTALSPFWL